jgi:cytochrome P450
MKHSLNIPQEFILTILNEQTGYFHQVEGWTLNCATIGAVLADLSLKSHVDTDEKSLFLLDSTKTGDPALDLCLEEIASHPGVEEPRYWIERLAVHSEDIIDTTLKHLIKSEILTHHDGDFYTTNHCAWHAELEQYPKSQSVGKYIKSRIEEVIFTDIIPDPRDTLIIGLLNACDIIKFIFELDEEEKKRIDLVCKTELINRVISTAVKQVAIAPAFQRSPLTKPIPKIPLKSLLSNRHLWDGNLPALFGNLADQYGPVFQIGAPFQEPRTFLAGPDVNRWMRQNSRRFLTSGHFFRKMETVCGANNLLPSMDGADHFRLRKLMLRIYSKASFHERLHDMFRLSRQFMINREWQAGSILEVQRDTRLMTNFQMSQVLTSTDSQDVFEDLVKWNERAILCYVADFLPKFLTRTPAMKHRFQLYEKLLRRIEENHIPIHRTGVAEELADELISLHNSDPQFIPEQNLLFMLAVTPVFQSIYLGDMLGFVLFEMARQPDIVARIREEADALFDGGDPDKDEFSPDKYDVTKRFLMECLRMYPIICIHLRDVANSCVVENYSLPLRERLYIVQTAAHYMSDCFPDPYEFDIDRYLPMRNEHRGPGYAPNGLDTHSCAGWVWMHLQLTVTVLVIAHHFEFAPPPKDYKLKINPFPALSVTEKLRLRIASQLREISA